MTIKHKLIAGVALLFGAIVIGASLCHLQFAGLGQLYRYDGYLFASGICAVAMLWPDRQHRFRFALGALVTLSVVAGGARAWASWQASLAMHDRYVQHVLPAGHLAAPRGVDAATQRYDLDEGPRTGIREKTVASTCSPAALHQQMQWTWHMAHAA